LSFFRPSPESGKTKVNNPVYPVDPVCRGGLGLGGPQNLSGRIDRIFRMQGKRVYVARGKAKRGSMLAVRKL